MNLQKSYSVDEAQKKLEFYCSYQERCHKEVYEKLKSMRMIPDAIDIIIVHLLQNNFLNEERFAKTFVSGKFRIKKWGKYRLTLELRKRDINKTIIKLALLEIDDTEYLQVFHDLAEKKAGQIKEPNVLKKKKKLADFLLYRGWESHLVYEKINALIS